LKNADLFRRIESLGEKLADKASGGMWHIDVESFSEEEKRLFLRVDEIEAKYLETGSMEPEAENYALISKNIEVILRRVREMYCYVVPMALGCDGSKDIVEYFFKLHFYNFELDLLECLRHVRTWTEKDRCDFLSDLAKNGPAFFRIPRGFNDHNQKTEKFASK
jgi:hypothetical protein